MTIKELATLIAKQEGKKHQATVGDVREILGLISDVIYSECKRPDNSANALTLFFMNGKKRAARKKK